MRLRLLALLAAAAALPVAAHAAKPKRTFSVNPPQQFVTALVQIRGANWPRCAARVGVTVRMPSGSTKTIGRPKLSAAGSFRTSWRPPRRLSGHTVRVRAAEACGGTGAVKASAPLKVLPTP